VCTASWLTHSGRLHLFFNRDELRTREPASPPGLAERGGVRYLAPVDGRAGGTWIAATERGSVLALLNRSGGARPPRALTRGEIVPALAGAPAPDEAERALRELSLDRFAPFRLAALWRAPAAGIALAWDGTALARQPLDPALGLLASSGLGDERAETVRGTTWRRRRAEAGAWTPAHHRAFHREHAPRRGAWSVCVHRREASTVSYTEVELAPDEIALRYFHGPPCTAGEPFALRLALPFRPAD
jgi:hypothetical protein